MRLYLDDDSVHPLLIRLLQQAGHDVVIPADVGNIGQHDAVQLRFAVSDQRVLLSHNHRDFRYLHELILETKGHHPGIVTVRRDNDPTRDLDEPGIVRALGKLIRSGLAFLDEHHILNHWR